MVAGDRVCDPWRLTRRSLFAECSWKFNPSPIHWRCDRIGCDRIRKSRVAVSQHVSAVQTELFVFRVGVRSITDI